MTSPAPVIIFAFNRPEAVRNTVNSLLLNEEAAMTDLYVFVDGARADRQGEQEKVLAVQAYVRSISGFRSTEYCFSEKNKGLAASIIQGVSRVINRHGRAIVLEDDLVPADNFLSFMNRGLDLYADRKKVFSVCGYSNRIKVPEGYAHDAYFCTRSSSWGWGTWADRWNSVDWELDDWDRYTKMKKAFNRWGGSDCWKMLDDWKHGKNQSWAIRFCFSQFMQDRLSLFPVTSKVRNDGFDGGGTNCKKWSRFRYDFDTSHSKTFNMPAGISVNRRIHASAMAYNGIAIRIFSRIMYLLYR